MTNPQSSEYRYILPTAAAVKLAFFPNLSTGYQQFIAGVGSHKIAGIAMVTPYGTVVNLYINFTEEFFLDNDVIFEKVKELLVSEFKVDAELIRLEKCLDEDLDLDSLDMVDLILALKDYIGEKVDVSLFKGARTVQDIVNLLQPLWKGIISAQKIDE